MMYVSCHEKDNSKVSRARTPLTQPPTPPLGAIAALCPSLEHTFLHLSHREENNSKRGINKELNIF